MPRRGRVPAHPAVITDEKSADVLHHLPGLDCRDEAQRALDALRAILSELGLNLKDAKTRIVELREGGEGLNFLGFQWAAYYRTQGSAMI